MTLNKRNFRRFAKNAVAAYFKKDMLVDAMLWQQIVAYYEAALTPDPKKPDKCNACKGTGRVKHQSNAHRLAISKAHFERVSRVDEARAIRAVVGAEEKPELGQ